jgi:predicted alpha/beta-fold hydrolase
VLGPLTIPVKEFDQSENLILATTTAGGHCCHFEGGRFGGLIPTMWFCKPIAEYLKFVKSVTANKVK